MSKATYGRILVTEAATSAAPKTNSMMGMVYRALSSRLDVARAKAESCVYGSAAYYAAKDAEERLSRRIPKR